ncbi:ParB N-terminal domain-containing protein [Sphingobium sp. TB-6]|uniref:ParB N-terminal domain-containing protein n=1 Tax=Sphingobium sp. TB-6 TaxID=2728850 RepID=UPI00146AC276|nr:ParB N-terminal domain-containing protein [Sphingobium sp. TB-6]NML88381.1 ParB N-terminal domain-containing protein [Sphingobium sp. TB-6]
MATAAKEITPVVASVFQIAPEDIQVDDRIGLFWPDKAAALGKLMALDGQHEPIKVRKNGARAKKPWTLVVGLHRLEGAKLEGFRAIDAIEAFGDARQLRDIEASENLHRRSLAPIERACFVRAVADASEARLKDQHGDLSPEQIAVRARWDAMRAKAPGVERDDDLNEAEADHTSANLALVYGWADETAEALGLSRRAMFRDLALHRAIVAPFPDLYRDLAKHPVAENASALREIAAIKDLANRRSLIEGLISNPELTLAQAKEGLGLSSSAAPAPTGATKFMNNTTANLARLSAGDQAKIAPEIVNTMKSSALLALRAALDARIQKEGIEA